MSNRTVAEALIKAQQFEDEDKFEQAYECYKYAYNIDKTDTEVLQKLATAAQMHQHNEDAINYWNEFMRLKPEDPISYNQLLDLYYQENNYEYYMTRAKLKTLEHRLAQATDDYKKAISNTSDDKEILTARYLLAQTYEILNKPMQAIDEYLKAHLFGDIFARDNIDWQTRELATIAMLASLSGVDSQLNSHINVGKHNGLTEAQVAEILEIAGSTGAENVLFGKGAENTAFA